MQGAGTLVNADIASAAAIAYSKLALAGSVVNADVATGAAIAISKLAGYPTDATKFAAGDGTWKMPDLPSVFVTTSAAISQGNNGGGTGGTVPLGFDTESWDTAAFHDPVTNNSRLTVPAGLAGKYVAIGFAEWAAGSAVGFREWSIQKSGGTEKPIVIVDGGLNSSVSTDQTITGFFSLAVTDYLTLNVYQNSGGSVNINAGATFGMVRISS